MFQKQSNLALFFSPLVQDGSCHTIGGIIQLIVGELMVSSLDGDPVRIRGHDLFEPLGDRLLDIFRLKLGEVARGMKTLSANGLLFRRYLHAASAKAPWRKFYSFPVVRQCPNYIEPKFAIFDFLPVQEMFLSPLYYRSQRRAAQNIPGYGQKLLHVLFLNPFHLPELTGA
jgi:hypothetical protein